MGAGNPLIRSFDPELYQPKTYFIDFSEEYESKESIVKENCDDDEEFNSLSEDEIYNRFDFQLERDYENFRDEYFLIDEFFNGKYWLEPNEHYSELSAEFRGNGIVIAKADDALIISTSDSELTHYAISIIPRFKYDEIEEEIDYEQQHKFDWYCARDKAEQYYSMVERLALKEYNKRLKLFRKTHEPTMHKLYEHWPKLRQRNGAWTTFPLIKIGKKFKFL